VGQATLIVKATRLCNLRCIYCNDWRTGRDQKMTFRVLAAMTARALEDADHDQVTFIWHGGESTIVGPSFYRKALYLQARLKRTGQVVRNQIQTNATRLTPEWLRFLKESEFGVGISIDGPPEVHDHYRRYASGRGSFGDVVLGMERLRDWEIPFTVLMVVDAEALRIGAKRIFDFFLEHDVRSFGFNAVCPPNQPHAPPGTPADHYVEPGRMTAFLADIYDAWRAHGDRSIRVRELAGIRARLGVGNGRPCTLQGGCLGSYFIVEPSGAVAHCDLFLGDARYALGNVLEDDFQSMRSGARMAALEEVRRRELEAMQGCPEFDVCNGWCPHEQYLAARHDPAYRADCCGLRPLIEHVRAGMAEEHRQRLVRSSRARSPWRRPTTRI
jgi:uncharacterized protein